MREIKCSCCKEPIQGIVYVKEFDFETPFCYGCMEQENEYDDIWESFYLSEYNDRIAEEEWLDYGDRKSKIMRDEL